MTNLESIENTNGIRNGICLYCREHKDLNIKHLCYKCFSPKINKTEEVKNV